jgi:hypothetical protein
VSYYSRRPCVAPPKPSFEPTPDGAAQFKRSPYGEINACSLKTESSSMQQ